MPLGEPRSGTNKTEPAGGGNNRQITEGLVNMCTASFDGWKTGHTVFVLLNNNKCTRLTYTGEYFLL